MVMNVLNNLVSIIGNSGFYFVPILSLMAFLNWRELTPGKGKQIFLLVAAVMTVTYLVLGTSSRYLLIPLILCAPLAGAGTTMLLRFLRIFRIFDWFKRRYMIWAFTVSAMVFPFWRLADRHHETVLFDFAAEMRERSSQPVILRSVDCTHGKVICGLLMYEKSIDSFDFEENWSEAMDFLTTHQQSPQDIYFFTRIPKRYTAEDMRRWFRGKYGIFPFDTVKQQGDYLLLKFNGQVLDGFSAPYSANALQTWQGNLLAETFRQWAKIRLPEPAANGKGTLIIPSGGTYDEKNIYLRLESGQIPANCRLELCNRLNWRWAYCDFRVGTTDRAALSQLAAAPAGKLRLNCEKPLILELEEYYLPQTQTVLYLSGIVPHWQASDECFELFPAAGTAAGTGEWSYRVSDRYRQQSSSGKLKITTADPGKLKQEPLKLILVEDQFAGTLDLAANLPALLHPASKIEVVKIAPHNANVLEDLKDLHLPGGKADVILLNTFCDSFARPWTVPLKVGPFMEKHLTAAVRKLRKTYPDALIAVILPPPPPAGVSMYPYCDSPLRARLAHYHITSELLVWQKRHKKNVELLPLAMSLHPQNGYKRYSNARPVWEGYKFSGAGRQDLAETAGAFLVNKLYDSR